MGAAQWCLCICLFIQKPPRGYGGPRTPRPLHACSSLVAQDGVLRPVNRAIPVNINVVLLNGLSPVKHQARAGLTFQLPTARPSSGCALRSAWGVAARLGAAQPAAAGVCRTTGLSRAAERLPGTVLVLLGPRLAPCVPAAPAGPRQHPPPKSPPRSIPPPPLCQFYAYNLMSYLASPEVLGTRGLLLEPVGQSGGGPGVPGAGACASRHLRW